MGAVEEKDEEREEDRGRSSRRRVRGEHVSLGAAGVTLATVLAGGLGFKGTAARLEQRLEGVTIQLTRIDAKLTAGDEARVRQERVDADQESRLRALEAAVAKLQNGK